MSDILKVRIYITMGDDEPVVPLVEAGMTVSEISTVERRIEKHVDECKDRRKKGADALTAKIAELQAKLDVASTGIGGDNVRA